MTPDLKPLTEGLKLEARRVGFDLVGVAPAVVPPGYGHYLEWLEEGREAGMAYLRRQAEARGHPRHVLEGVRSVVVVGMIYGERDLTPPGPTQGKSPAMRGGRLSRGALAKARVLAGMAPGRATRGCRPGDVRHRADPGAGLRPDGRPGLGGQDTCLIDRKAGSFTVLGALLIDIELAYDDPFEPDHCGTCTRCLDACPTDAFDGPYQLDSARCISYWTIEHRGSIPDEWAARLDGWAFGCDVCQDVCPWNRKAPSRP